jgi:hypothetical protein
MARLDRLAMLFDGKLPSQQDELARTLLDYEDYKFKVGEKFELYYKKNEYVN